MYQVCSGFEDRYMTTLPPITISPQAVATAIAQIKGLNPGDPRDAMMLDFYTKALFTEHGAHLPEFFLDGKIDATEAQYISLVTDTALSKADPFSSLEA